MIEIKRIFDNFLAKRLVVDEDAFYFDVYQKRSQGFIAAKDKKSCIAWVYDDRRKEHLEISAQ